MKRKSLVMVRWLDSNMSASWKHAEDLDKPEGVVCHTAGWIVKENRHAITIAGSVAGDPAQSSCRMTIPRENIRKILRFPKGETR